ncbi:ribonuclease Y [candidate division WWE3 bacterium]|nr:ribonuclease Y [candidate division WWE3 bacterium]
MADISRLDSLLATFNQEVGSASELKSAAKELVIEAKAQAINLKEEADQYMNDARKVEQDIAEIRIRLQDRLKELSDLRDQEIQALEKTGTLSAKEVEDRLLELIDKQLIDEYAKRVRDNEEKVKTESDRRARTILVTAMQRVATENVSEYTTYTIDLPDEEMKGRIIGKDGRNIKAFEDAAGVSVEIGEEGEPTVTVSSFDPVKREIARRAMEKLVADGRIQPSRIEECVDQAEDEVAKIVQEAGEDLLYRAGITGLPQEIIQLLGRLKFRSSYGQNMIEHTLEVVRLGALIAAEVGADVEIVKQACLLHDIGKAVTAETEKGHAEAGADICRRYGVKEAVVVGFEGHHTDNFQTIEAVVMYLADAISGARPGARKEDYDGYVNRVKELESIANSFKGVERSFAISAGREVRVLVKPAEITDAEMVKLAHDISRTIHEQVANFPAPIKVTVIRETKATAIAKPRNS